MLPVSFGMHCSSCHQLAFDLSAPGREVPHGDPAAALSILTEFYSDLALRASSDEVLIEFLENADADESLQWAREQAEIAASSLFEDRVCIQCHQVKRIQLNSGVAWTIDAVHLNQSWFPAADFDHASHLLTECEDCHAARGSGLSNDILIPDIVTCRECHGGELSRRTLESTCTTCHSFHGTLRQQPVSAKEAVTGTLLRYPLPDLEQKARESRGADPLRKRPGSGA